MTTTYLITGANRGIGFTTTKKLAEDDNNLVIATARDVKAATALRDLNRSNIKIIELDVSASLSTIKEKLTVLDKIAPDGVDVVLQNAGIYREFEGPSASISLDTFTDHFDVNTLGPIKLYQAVFPYWTKAHDGVTKKFAFVSSGAGSFALQAKNPFLTYGYGLSKAALNFFVAEIARENADNSRVVVSIHPGLVSTDMGSVAIDKLSLQDWSITPQESGDAIAKLLAELTPEKNGQFFNYDGTNLEW